MWAIGCLAFNLIEGLPPFRKSDFLLKICSGAYDFNSHYWNSISSDAKDFISRLLVVDPARRMTAREAMHHIWLHCENTELQKHNLNTNLKALKKFNAASKLRKGMLTVLAMNMFSSPKNTSNATAAPSPTPSDEGDNDNDDDSQDAESSNSVDSLYDTLLTAQDITDFLNNSNMLK